MKISLFIPVRTGSTRAKNKNTREFTPNGESLVDIKLSQVIKVKEFDEIVLSTNCDLTIEIAKKYQEINPNLKVVRRVDNLCLSTTKVEEIIEYVPSVTSGDFIMWSHVTSPFVNEHDFRSAIKLFKSSISKGYDTVMSVNKIQNFIWDEEQKDLINNKSNVNRWPNTQDLKPMYEINHAFYMTSRDMYVNENERIGKNPILYECEGEKRIDIDWEFDFQFAQKVWRGFYPNS